MADVLIFEIADHGDDVLYVAGSVDGAAVEATGWVSATTSHYDDDQYADYTEADVADEKIPVGTVGRHLKPGATPRALTGDEARAYVEQLLLTQAGAASVAAELPPTLAAIPLDPVPDPAPAEGDTPASPEETP